MARLFGVCERTFRRYIDRYEEEGLDGLIDKQLEQSSHRRAPAEEIVALTERYRKRHLGPKEGVPNSARGMIDHRLTC